MKVETPPLRSGISIILLSKPVLLCKTAFKFKESLEDFHPSLLIPN
jgi:hypothetical protein